MSGGIKKNIITPVLKDVCISSNGFSLGDAESSRILKAIFESLDGVPVHLAKKALTTSISLVEEAEGNATLRHLQ